MKILIPKLNRKIDYRNWSEGIIPYMKTKSLGSYLDFAITGPILEHHKPPINNAPDDILKSKLETADITKLSLALRRELFNEIVDFLV